jgi:DNA-binding NtrC family response regulator
MAEHPNILVIDDEASIRLLLKNGLAAKGFRVTAVSTGRAGLAAVNERTNGNAFDAVVSDVYMPDGDGLMVARELHASHPQLPVVLMTAQGTLDLTVHALAEGVTDFIAKPFEVAALAELLHRCLDARRAAEQVVQLDELQPDEMRTRFGLVGHSPAMVKVYKLVAHAARTDATVLLTGASGTGKELAARAIHELSARAGKPFITVNCAGLTDTLLESELFGHAKGAFTGATAERAGLFEAADSGTILLDELATTSPAFQASLLRVLQSGEVRRVGTTATRRVNVRVLGASNAPLDGLVKSGSFRADLYYRLSVLTIDLPVLNQRAGDVELLSRHFLQRANQASAVPLTLTDEALRALCAYDFPGNVRELENALIRAVALASNGLITLDCLPPQFAGVLSSLNSSADGRGDGFWGLAADRPTLDELQRRYLQVTLDEVGGHRRLAAERLGLHRRTIQRLIARYQLSALPDDEVTESSEMAEE